MPMENKLLKGTISRSFELPYYLYLPKGYDPQGSDTWPVVIFLHGAGERGTDLERLKRQGLVKQIAEGQEFPFILVAPQCLQNDTWDRSLDELDALFAELMDTLLIDRERIYLTGLSMGGFGTWHWAARRPQAFAALVPICGGTMPLLGFPERIGDLKDIPIWVFHGEDDQVVPIKMSAELVEVLVEAGSSVKFTRYPGVGHDSWSLAYDEPELFPWLLAQKNPRFNFEKRVY